MDLGRFLIGSELRRRWRTVLALTLLVAVVGTTVLTATAGARRTRTAFDRALEQVHGADLMIGAQTDPVDADEVAAVDGVRAVVPFTWYSVFADPEKGFYPMLVPGDDRIPNDYMRTRLVDGRRPDPSQPDEVMVGEHMAGRLHLEVGDDLPLVSFTPAGTETILTTNGYEFAPDGPPITLHVTGIARTPADIAGRLTDIDLTFLTPAFAERHGKELGTFESGAVVFYDRGASADVVTRAINDVAGDRWTLDEAFASRSLRSQVDPTMASMADALYVVAAAAGLVGLIAIALASARANAGAAADGEVLRAMGIGTRWELGRLVAPGLVAAVVGTALAVAASIALSALLPFGLARRAEPEPGVRVDGSVLVLGIAVALVAVGLVVVLAALSARRRSRHATVGHPSRLAGMATSAGLPVAVVSGLRFALDRERGPRATPVLTAALATGVAVAGVLAALIVGASIDHAIATPAIYGTGWDALIVGSGSDNVSPGRLDVDGLRSDPSFRAVAEVYDDVELELDGAPASGLTIDDLRGHVPFVVVSGREPTGDKEIALGTGTLHTAGVAIGDTVELSAGGDPVPMTVVGTVALPVSADGGSNRQGVALTREAADRAGYVPDCDTDESECSRNYAVTADGAVDLAAIRSHFLPDAQLTVSRPVAPGDVDRLSAVSTAPKVLAGLLALIGAVAISYVAASTVRHRRRELALLRVLGLSGGQLRSVLAVQLAALSAAGALVGVVVGSIIGAGVWRSIADAVAIPFVVDRPALFVVAVPLGAVALGLLLSIAPGQRASHLAPAVVLRSEGTTWR